MFVQLLLAQFQFRRVPQCILQEAQPASLSWRCHGGQFHSEDLTLLLPSDFHRKTVENFRALVTGKDRMTDISDIVYCSTSYPSFMTLLRQQLLKQGCFSH
jgi:hypothetical protein